MNSSIHRLEHCAGIPASKFVLQWELQVSLPYTITENYKSKWMFSRTKNCDIWE
jgi:hypothetical protein